MDDVWFFPSSKPHSSWTLDEGAEFLFVFESGSFSEDNTFLATKLFLRTPRSVLARDLKTDISAFNKIPQDQLYIFPGKHLPLRTSPRKISPAQPAPLPLIRTLTTSLRNNPTRLMGAP